MTEFVQGTCEDMCPQFEVKLRTKEHLLHFFEQEPGKKNVPCKVVKAFSRSAAGIKTPRKTDLRTPRALEKTVEYLLKDIMMDKRKPLPYVYDFVFDRLRCVRQEIVMQNLNTTVTLNLLEPIIIFLAYSRFRLCTETIDDFDPAICDQHLQECLKKVLCCYDELDLINTSEPTLLTVKRRIFIEALYQIFNMGSHEALERSLSVPKCYQDSIFGIAQRMSLEVYRRHYYLAIKLIPGLPHILAAIASLKLPYMRRQLYQIFSTAYNSKNLTVPIEWLQRVLLYSNAISTINDCKYYGLEVQADGANVKLSKTAFSCDANKLQGCIHERFVEEKLEKVYLPDILLLRKF